MARHSLTASKLNSTAPLGGAEDPMGSLGNLMDVMLVFACGLILALIAHWGVDVAGTSASLDNAKIQPIDGELKEAASGISTGDDTYKDLGKVYLDEETGQLYVVSP